MTFVQAGTTREGRWVNNGGGKMVYRRYRQHCSKCGQMRTGAHFSHCLDCVRQIPSAKRDPERRKAQKLKHLLASYGMSVADYVHLLEAQGNGCAICNVVSPGGQGRWHIDHSHAQNRVRGLLCTQCNVALGMARDDPTILRKMADYLEQA